MNYENTFAYLDDILIVTKGSKDTQKKLNKLNDKNLAVSVEKCNFEWDQLSSWVTK